MDPVLVIVSVDTEEDNWLPTRHGISIENIRELPRLSGFLGRIGARVTYFTTYQVAAVPWGAELLRELDQAGGCEIAVHLHPWNTLPYTEAINPRTTMLANLSLEEQVAKIEAQSSLFEGTFGQRPTVFRAGRWGLNVMTARALLECGYQVDSSVTPYKSWLDDFGPSHLHAPLEVYRLDGYMDHRKHAAHGSLVEVPTSWGYHLGAWGVRKTVQGLIESTPEGMRRRLSEIAARLHMINHVVLSPEMESEQDMIGL